MIQIQSHKENLINKISSFLKRKHLILINIGLLKSLFLLLMMFIFFSSLESFFYFSVKIKTFIIISILFVFTLLTLYFILTPLKKYFRSKSFDEIEKGADEIGRYYPNIKDNLLNALQLIASDKSNSSQQLTQAAFENIYNKVSELNFYEILNFSQLKKKIIAVYSVVIIASILFVSFTPLSKGALRLIKFTQEFIKPIEFSLEVLTKNKKIKKGDNILIKVKISGKSPSSIYVSTKSIIESEYSKHLLKLDSNNIASLEFKGIKNEFSYFAYSEDIFTDTYQIDVTSPPLINMMSFELIPPKYSKLPITIQENNGNITALKGTNVNYSFTSTKELVSALRISELGKSDTLIVNQKNISGKFKVLYDDKYLFNIIDKDSAANENPIQYSIKVLSDKYPEIEIIKPDQISLIPTNDIVSIQYLIKDDFGFSKVFLWFTKSNVEEVNSLATFDFVELNINKFLIEQSLYFNWDVSKMNLKGNEVVSYFLEVIDNDIVSGPKSTKSPLYKLRVPTLDELFVQAENNHESSIEELEETLKDAEELQKELKQLNNELKQDQKEINWNEKERVEQSVKKFEELADKIDEVQKKIEDMQKQLSENNLLSEETMKKYNELQDLMEQLNSDEMKKALENMQKSLEQLMRDKVQQSLENLTMNEEMFQKSIERTLNLLKKIQVEQKIDEIIKRTENIIDDLEKLSKKTESNLNEDNKSVNQELADEQKDIENQLNSLENEMAKLQEKMSELSDMPNQKMEKLNQQYSEQKNQELSKEAMQLLQEKNPFDALKNQQQLSQNMNSMMEQMQNMQQQMQQQSQQMVMQNMLKAIENIISLSKEQELLNNETNKQQAQPRDLPNIADQQMDLRQNLNNILKQLGELSQKTFAITPEMGEKLGKAKKSMDEALSGMQNRNGQKSTFNQGEAMGNLNEAASLLQSSLQAMMQGGGQGSGMMSLMQQLQQMAQQQMGLNQMTQMMQQGQLTMQQQAQLQRLAQEQSAIQKSLSELNKEAKEAGESKKLSTNLDQVLEEMKEVVSGLNTQKIDNELIRQQEKILSKLLDAQRSINERDFEKNRESFSGKEFNLTSPNELILSNEQAKDILREELLKSIKEGYSKDYQKIIRRYFESLDNSSK